jgi:predicted permease
MSRTFFSRDRFTSVAVRIYGLLLFLLPPHFRRGFGSEMVQLFRDHLAEATTPLGRLGVLIHSGTDLLSTALGESGTNIRASFSNMKSLKETNPMQTVLRDLRHALRGAIKNPGFTVLSALTLGLGIGAFTVAFSLVNGVLLKPLPFPEPQRLVYLMEEGTRGRELMLSWPNFDDWRKASRSFQEMAAVQFSNEASVLGGEEPTRATVLSVSREFFQVVGIPPILGRPILPEENRPGADPLVVVSHEFWERFLGAREELEALTISFYGGTWQVVGVMPPGFEVLEEADLYIAMEGNPVPIRTAHNYRGIGRLAPGITLDQADQELDRLAANIKSEYGDDSDAEAVVMRPLRDAVVGEADTPLLLLLIASGVLLLIACTNQASNLLARGTHRREEMAIRSAMGARRSRLVQQLMVESVMLSGLGWILGLAITLGTLMALRVLGPDLVPRLDAVGVEPAVLLIALLAALGTSLFFGLFPAFRTLEGVAGTLSSEGQRGNTGFRKAAWEILVAAEVAMAVILVVGSGLLVRSLQEILSTDTGFRAEGVLTLDLDPSGQGFDTEETRTALFHDLKRELSAMPEVASVGFANRLPTQARTWTGPVLRSPVSDREDREEWVSIAGWRVVDEDYFNTMGVPLQAGRFFSPGVDGAEGPPVVILNRSLADRAFPDEDPLGKQVQALWDRRAEDLTVVGVVAEARDWRREAGAQPEIYVYWPQRLENTGYMTAVLRPRAGQVIGAREARAAVRSVAPSMPLQISTVEARVGESLKERRFTLSVLGCFSLAALLLSAVGIFGVVSYTVSRRTREIGIRLALGAGPRLLRRRIFTESIRVVGIGAGVGVLAAILMSRLMEALLFGISPKDPVAMTLAPLIIMAVAALAIWVPVLRYTRVDPTEAMRAE